MDDNLESNNFYIVIETIVKAIVIVLEIFSLGNYEEAKLSKMGKKDI